MKLREIFKRAKSDDSEAIRADIAALEREAEEARASIARHADDRRAALLADDDKALDAIEAGREAASRTLERAELALPELRSRLATITAAERAAAIERCKADGKALAREVESAVIALVAANDRVAAYVDRARETLGDHAAARAGLFGLAYMTLPSREGLAEWQRWLASLDGAPVSTAAPPVPRVARLPVKKIEPERQDAAPRAPRAPLRPATETPPPGFHRVQVMRTGYEAPDGTQCVTGDVLDLPEKVAAAAEINGAVLDMEKAA